MLNEKLLLGIIRKLNIISDRNSSTSLANSFIVLIGHMNLLEKYMKSDFSDWSPQEHKYYRQNRVLSQLKATTSSFLEIIPQYNEIISSEYLNILSPGHPRDFEIYKLLEHCVDLLDISLVGEKDVEDGKVYLGIKEKLKQAGQSFRNGDYPGLFSSLHTSVELTMKDKLSIPLSIGEIKIGRIIGVCIKNNVFKNRETMLKDIDNKICQRDNKIKHSGYNPSPGEASTALLVAEQSLRLLEEDVPILEEPVKKEISSLLI